MENIVLIGIGGHAKGIVDTIEKQNKYHIVGFVDKISEPKKYKGYEVIGDDADLETIFSRDRVKKLLYLSAIWAILGLEQSCMKNLNG